MIHSLRRALTRLWRRREPEPCPIDWHAGFHWAGYSERAIEREMHDWEVAARDHDQPDFDPRPDDVLAGRS